MSTDKPTILYEDNHLIAVYKPAGVPVVADDSKDDSLFEQVKRFIKERDAKPGNVFLGVIHRLDRPVSGIVLFAKTSKGASRLSDQFRRHIVKKTYTAKIQNINLLISSHGHQGKVLHWLKKDEARNFVSAFNSAQVGAQLAETDWQIGSINAGDQTGELIVNPKTGRSHQIRVALASLGHPIIGDIKYGSKISLEDGHALALCATKLEFDHPTTGERVTVSI